MSESPPIGYLLDEMQPKSDAQLLRDYAERGVEAAFTELVQRHTNLIYSAALRQVELPVVAAEITQNVFVALAHGSKSLVPKLRLEASLAGWLCRSARNLSLNHRRDEFRRQTRERLAMDHLVSTPEAAPNWEHLRGLLDDTMSELDETDYDALVLRFYQNRDLRAVGAAIGVSDDAAQKRVTRALDKLRERLAQRDIRTTAAALSVALSANAVQAAPAGLAVTISAAALAGTATTASAVLAAATKTIAMTTFQKALVATTVTVLTGAGVYELRQSGQLRNQVQALQKQHAPLLEQIQQWRRAQTDATNQLNALRLENERLQRDTMDVLRLRREVAELRSQQVELTHSLALANGRNTPAASMPAEPPSSLIIPKDSWAFRGYATPEAALESVVWAMRRGDLKSFLGSLTPEARQQMELDLKGKEPSEVETSLRVEADTLGALRLDQKRDSATDEVSFVVFSREEDNGATRTKDETVMKFQNVGGIWKYAPR